VVQNLHQMTRLISYFKFPYNVCAWLRVLSHGVEASDKIVVHYATAHDKI